MTFRSYFPPISLLFWFISKRRDSDKQKHLFGKSIDNTSPQASKLHLDHLFIKIFRKNFKN